MGEVLNPERYNMKHNKQLTVFAQKLRKEMTQAEKHLWYQFLRSYPVQFRRQVTCGQYILDFYCSKAKLAIELDGSQHYTTEGKENDLFRTKYLNALGIYVLRIPNNLICGNFKEVCDMIDQTVKNKLNKA